MKKISKINWGLFKESPKGQEAIVKFSKLSSADCSIEEMLSIAKSFSPLYFCNVTSKEEEYFLKILQEFDDAISNTLPEFFDDEEDLWNYYSWLLKEFATGDDSQFEDIPQSKFKYILQDNIFLSTILHAYLPSYYIPNYFVLQFLYLNRFAKKYEIDLPKVPNRSDYKNRCLYYIEICKILRQFREENGFDSPADFCAYLYGYELPLIKEEMESDYSAPKPIQPENAWILVGNYGEGEKNMNHGLWQANQLTSKGDVLLFYEKSPVKKLNAIWIALEDGVVDPFFHYYSYTIIGDKIEIPNDKAISFDEFKNCEYFKNRSKEGNYVRKNFQDVSGWAVTSSDYKEIKRMLEDKGFDTSILPSLYEPKKRVGVNIELEADVSNKLLVPLLEEMGWKRDVDFKAEVEFPAGRGTTGHQMEKRPDFCLHLTGKDKDLGAKVVIEVKLWMKNNEEIEANYYQGLSYAKWGNAQVLVLCDKNQIRVYERNKKGEFDKNNRVRFRWEEMENLEKFNELKRMLNI
ncbi:MAG: type I restriction endonuclease subunit R [Prevotella sp.]|nr:type I restriction endonuclease subunit R [Prevotella sp.]